jgi:putative solute:sodium symporter small subunit
MTELRGDEPAEASKGSPQRSDAQREIARRYWRSNIRIMAVLLIVWAIAGLGCGVLFADSLSQVRLGGYPLGFWFAQQGSIIVFVALILVYALALNRLDAKHHAELEKLKRSGGDSAV